MPTRRRSTRWAGGCLWGDVSERVLTCAPFGRAVDPRFDLRERPSVQAILGVKRDAPGVFHRRAAADRGQFGERPRAVGETPGFFQIGARLRSAEAAGSFCGAVFEVHSMSPVNAGKRNTTPRRPVDTGDTSVNLTPRGAIGGVCAPIFGCAEYTFTHLQMGAQTYPVRT
jgi:hypothetical protein